MKQWFVGASLAFALSAGGAEAGVVFDNFTSSAYQATVSDQTYTAVFRSDVTQTVNQIGARISTPDDLELKFLIFDLGDGVDPLSGSTAPIVLSQTKSFGATTGFEYLYSNSFDFTLQANRWYAVGAISPFLDFMTISYDDADSVTPGNGFTARADQNMNVFFYGSPQGSDNFGCCNIHYQLVTSDSATVPEPTTWALMILGFGAAGAMLRRRASYAI
jgi:hypothetical protein